MNGVIKSLKKDKGFGFIRANDGKDYFFHFSSCESKRDFEAMEEKVTKVSFEVVKGNKGPRAESVVVL